MRAWGGDGSRCRVGCASCAEYQRTGGGVCYCNHCHAAPVTAPTAESRVARRNERVKAWGGLALGAASLVLGVLGVQPFALSGVVLLCALLSWCTTLLLVVLRELGTSAAVSAFSFWFLLVAAGGGATVGGLCSMHADTALTGALVGVMCIVMSAKGGFPRPAVLTPSWSEPAFRVLCGVLVAAAVAGAVISSFYCPSSDAAGAEGSAKRGTAAAGWSGRFAAQRYPCALAADAGLLASLPLQGMLGLMACEARRAWVEVRGGDVGDTSEALDSQ